MRTKLLVITLGLLVASGAALAQPAARQGSMRWNHHPMLFAQLKLTEQQKVEARKVWFDLMQKQIDVRAQLAHARLDYRELATANTPDQKALNAKIQDMANLKAQLQQNKLDAWFSVNKLLTAEQQKVWKKVLEHPMSFDRRGRTMGWRHSPYMMGRGGMMGRSQMMMRGGAWPNHAGPMMWRSQKWQGQQTPQK